MAASLLLDQLAEEVDSSVILQIINKASEANGSDDYGSQIKSQGLSSHHLVHHQDGSKVAGRPRHQQHQSCPRGQTFEHQCHSYGYAPGCTDVHRYGYSQNQQDRSPGVPLENRKPFLRHEGGDQGSHYQSQDEPAPYVLHHIHEGIVERILQFTGKTCLYRFRLLHGARSSGTIPVKQGVKCAAEQCRHQSRKRSDYSKWQSHKTVGCKYAVNAGLGRCDQE